MGMVKDARLKAKGYQQIVNPGSSTALTVPSGSQYAMFNVEGANGIRFTDDGTTPTASVGMLLTAGTNYWYTGYDLADVRVIAGGAAGTLNILYYS